MSPLFVTWGSRHRERRDPPRARCLCVVGPGLLPYLLNYLHQSSNMQLTKQFYGERLTCNPNSPEKLAGQLLLLSCSG